MQLEEILQAAFKGGESLKQKPQGAGEETFRTDRETPVTATLMEA
jgi:hypothetical protein